MSRITSRTFVPLALVAALAACSDSVTGPPPITNSTPVVLSLTTDKGTLYLDEHAQTLSDGKGHSLHMSSRATAAMKAQFHGVMAARSRIEKLNANFSFQTCLAAGHASGREVRARYARPASSPQLARFGDAFPLLASAPTPSQRPSLTLAPSGPSREVAPDSPYAERSVCQDLAIAIYQTTREYKNIENEWSALVFTAILAGFEVGADGFFVILENMAGSGIAVEANLMRYKVELYQTQLNILATQYWGFGCANVPGDTFGGLGDGSYHPPGDLGTLIGNPGGIITCYPAYLYMDILLPDGSWLTVWEGWGTICS